jgi:hypothetical protein
VTIVNHFTSRDQAVVVCDSLAICGGRPAAWQPKFMLFPHAAMILTGRGPDDVLWRCNWDLSHHHFAGGVDGASKILPGILEHAQGEMHERYPHAAVDLATELAAVGYSPAAAGYRAVHFQSRNGFEPEPQPLGMYLSPAPAGYRPGRLEAPTDQMWIACAKEQQRQLQAEKAPGEWASVGGDVFSVTLTKAGIDVRKLGRLPMYDEATVEMRAGEGRPVPSPISRVTADVI